MPWGETKRGTTKKKLIKCYVLNDCEKPLDASLTLKSLR
jgi:hypothetical protein